MAQYFSLHPEQPQARLVRQAAEILRGGGLVALPTDSAYALACQVGDAALLVNPYSVDELAAGMARLFDDPQFNQDLRNRGLHHAADFTWERTATETLRVLRSAIQTGKQTKP